jgi:hypothetical protein
MTAQIISLADYRNTKDVTADPVAATVPGSTAVALPRVAPRVSSATVVKSSEATIVTATAALSAACKEMAMNLALLMTHAEAACHSIGDIGSTAEALVRTGADLRQVADSFKDDHNRMSGELAAVGLAGATV